MITKGNFLLLSRDEFRTWLQAQKVTRKIDKLQVHHTASPNYTTRKLVNGVSQQDKFECLEGMRNYHIHTNGWAATAQHLTTFEDGMIAVSLDRKLNMTPIGITGANAKAVCIENIGDFDKGDDMITDEQRKTIAYLYACLAERFGMPIDTAHIVYHCWYSAAGTRLADYTPGKSVKSCPGTNFWGDGNTVADAGKRFLPAVRDALYKLKNGDDDEMSAMEEVQKIQKVVAAQAEIIAKLEKEVEKVDPPTWFVNEFGDPAKLVGKNGKTLINDPLMSLENWRQTAFMLRETR